MIHLKFIEPKDSDWIQWIEDCKTETDNLIRSYRDGNRIEISKLYSNQKDKFLDEPFYGKCAYCEASVEVTSPTYVEHYRPKGGVRYFDNKSVMISKNGTNIPHPGYYWLAYDWKNLLPTCWRCNTWHKDEKTGKMIGKGTRFPVVGKHAINVGDEHNELPALINPMWEEPNDYIFMDNLGIIHAKDLNSRGNITLELFGLNTREALVQERKKEYDNIERKVKALFSLDNEESKKREFRKVMLIAKGTEEFTLAARKAIADVLSSYEQTINSLKNTL